MSLIALAFVAALGGQDPVAYSAVCYEEGREAACEQAELARLNRLYRVDRIEDAASSGAKVYRVLVIDDYGRDVVLVTAVSQSGQSPRIIVQGRKGRRLASSVSRSVWRQVVREARGVDQVRPPPTNPDLEEICIHGWSVRLEMANAVDAAGRSRPVRRVRQNGCDYDDRAVEFGLMLTRLALEALPVCRELNEASYRTHASQLRDCVNLGGDRPAAANLMTQKGDPPGRYGDLWVVGEWAAWLATGGEGRLEWAGMVHQEGHGRQGGSSVAEALVEHAQGLADLEIWQEEFGARDGREGWINGTITYRASAEGEPARRMVADYRQEWVRTGSSWCLSKWTVDPFRPLPPSE